MDDENFNLSQEHDRLNDDEDKALKKWKELYKKQNDDQEESEEVRKAWQDFEQKSDKRKKFEDKHLREILANERK